MQVPWGDAEKAHSRAVLGRRTALGGRRSWARSAGSEGLGLIAVGEPGRGRGRRKKRVGLIEAGGGRKQEEEERAEGGEGRAGRRRRRRRRRRRKKKNGGL